MVETEIQILITAIDNATKTLDRIEKQVTSGNKKMDEANKSLSTSFTKVQGAMMNLVGAAQSFHQFLEIGEQRTRSLENAQDRLENATIRLQNAQDKLNEVNRSAAQQNLDVEKATLANTRAQDKLKDYTDQMAKGVTFIGDKLKDYQDAQLEAKQAAIDLSDAQQKVADQATELSRAQDAVTISNNNMERTQRAVQKATDDAKWSYLDQGLAAVSAVGSLGIFAQSLGLIGAGATTGTIAIGGLSIALGPLLLIIAAIVAVVGYVILLWKNWETMSNNLRVVFFLLSPALYIVVWAVKALQDNWQTLMGWFQSGWDLLKQLATWLDSIFGGSISKAVDLVKSLLSLASGVMGAVGGALSAGTKTSGGGSSGGKKNDFISRPGEAAQSFSSADTIIGMKNPSSLGGGMSITITGNIYGTDPDEISEAILAKLRKQVTI